MKKVYTLGPDGRLFPEGVDAVLPDQPGNDGRVLETDGTASSWKPHVSNKGFSFEVDSTSFSNGYIVMDYVPVDVSSIRVYAVGSTFQLSEEMAVNLPSHSPDFAYRFLSGEPRLYFRNVAPVSGLSESPINLYAIGRAYIVYCDTEL